MMNLRVMFIVACSILGISTGRTISTRSGCCDIIQLSYPNQDLGKVLGKYRKSANVSQTYTHVDYHSIELRVDGEGNWIFGDTLVQSVTENAACSEDVSLWKYRSGSSWIPSDFVKVSCEEGQVLSGEAEEDQVLPEAAGWNLTLLHVNDIHSRVEETNKYSSECGDEDRLEGKCYGGVARLKTAVDEVRNSEENVVFMSAGDWYQGTIWYTYYKWRMVAKFSNLLGFDVATLGNHEFDDGVDGLVPFLANTSYPVVVANLDMEDEPQLRDLVVPSTVLEVGGKRVGVIGYLTPGTAEIADIGRMDITDEVEAVGREAQRLHEAGIQIIVALGHSGFDKDRELATLVPHVDIVVGGHSDTFLYSGDDVGESRRKPENGHHHKGDYPAVVRQEGSGRTVLVVQAYANMKYLGHLSVRFDKEGEVEGWSGAPTLLDQSVGQDPAVAAEVASMRAEIDEFTLEVVGRLEETLHHSREAESSMGNLVADAAAWSWANLTSPPVQLAMINSGSMRPKLAGASLKEGEVTLKDLLTYLPYQSSFNMVALPGSGLKAALEHSVSLCGLDPNEGCDGQFLQLSSGFRVVYDLTQPAGSRLVSARVRIGEEVGSGLGSISQGEELQEGEGDKSEEFQEVEDDTVYQVVTTDYLLEGGDGYKLVGVEDARQGRLETDVLREYFGQSDAAVRSELEGRIMFCDGDCSNP